MGRGGVAELLDIPDCPLVEERNPLREMERFYTRRVKQLEDFIEQNGLTPPACAETPPPSPSMEMSCSMLSPMARIPARIASHNRKKDIKYKLSSHVLTMTREGMIHKSLADILMETAQRADVRDPDTPAMAKGNILRSFDDASDEDSKKRGRSTSLPEPSLLPPSSSEKRSTSPAKAAPKSPSSISGKVAEMLKGTKKDKKTESPATLSVPSNRPPPMESALLDRIATKHSLDTLRNTDGMLHTPFPPLARQAMDYVASAYDETTNTFTHDYDTFYTMLDELCTQLIPTMSKEPVYVRQTSPCYAFGDTHGNYADVSYFLENIINFIDLEYTPCNLIFLGDYVDRGPYGLEVLCLLLSLKLSNPKKVTLLRGNHEDPLVNGDVRHYGDSAFQRQCQKTFGNTRGMHVWTQMNELFRHFPLACEIDGKIFCCHGGLPRYCGGRDDRLDTLRDPKFPHLEMFSMFEPAVDESSRLTQMASDLCWSDPKDLEGDAGYWELNEWGFGNNSRGDGVICFGEKAVDDFCDRYGFDFIFRAHQEKSDGMWMATPQSPPAQLYSYIPPRTQVSNSQNLAV